MLPVPAGRHRAARPHRPLVPGAVPAAAPVAARRLGPRGPARPHRARRHAAAGRRHRRVRLRPRRGLGGARRVERRPRHARRAAARRGESTVWRRRAAAPRGGPARPRRVVHDARCSTPSGPTPGWTGSATCSTAPAGPARAPAHPAPGHPQRLGGGLLRPRPGPAAGARRPRPRRSAWSGSCSTTAGSAAAATTPPGSATGTSTTGVWPDGLHPLIDHVTRPGHAVRAVGRAGDGQPRLRPVPRAPRLGARRAGRGCRRPGATSRCSTWPARRRTTTCWNGSTRC